MRPLKLTLRGINSYRKEQTIDFEALTSAGLFGIFGPTGSGKSSILDAITLALYAKLPRSTKNFININEETAAVSFLFSITTTKTHLYQVERAFRYHRGSSSSTVRNTGASLAEITEEGPRILADRPTEVTQECTRLLGLSSDDFMRTVVLPQGQFSEFLQLKNAERRGMLQRIFHLEEYGLALTQKIAGARQKQELALSSLDGQLQAYENISEETLTEARQAHEKLLEDLKVTGQQKKEAEQAFQKADAIRTLLEEYLPVRKRWEHCEKQLPSIKEKEQRLALGKKAAQIRPFARQVEKTAAEAREAKKALQETQAAVHNLQTSCEELKKQREAHTRIYADRLPFLLQQEQEYDTAAERRQAIREWQTRLTKAETQLHQTKEQQTQLQKQINVCLRTEETLRHTILQKEKESAAVRPSREETEALEKGHVLEETYREKRMHFEEEKKAAQALALRLQTEKETLSSLTDQLQALRTSVKDQLTTEQQELSSLTESLAGLMKQKDTAAQKAEELQNTHMALLLRSRLQEGEVCPVCGGIHHASPDTHRDEDSAVLAQLKEQQTQMESLEVREKELETQQQAAKQRISVLSMHLESIRHLLPELPQAEDFSPQSTEENSVHAERNALSDISQNESPKSLQAARNQPLSPDALRTRLQTLSTDFLSCRERLAQLTEQYRQAREQNITQYQRLQQSLQEILTLRRQWNTENFTVAVSEKQAAEKQYDQLQEEILRLRKEQEEIRLQKETLTAEQMRISGQLAAVENEQLHCRSRMEEEEKKLPEGSSAATDFLALLEKTRQQRAALEEQKATLEQQYQDAAQTLQGKKEALSAIQNQNSLCRKNQQQAEETLQKQLRLVDFPGEVNLEDACLSPETMDEMERELQDFQEEYASIRERLSYLEEKKQAKTLEEGEWQEKKEALNQAASLLENQQKEEAVLAKDIASLQQKLTQKKELLARQKEALHRRGLIRQLEQLFKGNAFIEYVSESRLRSIAAEASVILSSISNGNYELEINENAEFVIRDNKNGGIRRPCDTLSGGETFITSLSLALALSSAIQLNGTAPLELFFLDEGFGNLDEELLDVVMTSLERIQNTRRSIGIITHVEAIQARVPVKLIVTPSDISQNGSSIRMEYS